MKSKMKWLTPDLGLISFNLCRFRIFGFYFFLVNQFYFFFSFRDLFNFAHFTETA